VEVTPPTVRPAFTVWVRRMARRVSDVIILIELLRLLNLLLVVFMDGADWLQSFVLLLNG